MEVLRTIKLFAESHDMSFLVIGGHAVNAYGLSRQTGDLDLLVDRSQSEKWHSLLERLDYSSDQLDERFARYRSQQIASWPIDLMFVDTKTFATMYGESLEVSVGVARVQVISARHLVMLKIHALKHFQEHRYLKDFGDVLGLLRARKAVFSDEELKGLCVKYATEDLYKRIKGGV